MQRNDIDIYAFIFRRLTELKDDTYTSFSSYGVSSYKIKTGLISFENAKNLYEAVMKNVELWRENIVYYRECKKMGAVKFCEYILQKRVKVDRHYKNCHVKFKESFRRKGGYFNYIDYEYKKAYVLYDGSSIYIYNNKGVYVTNKKITGKYLDIKYGKEITKAGFNRALSIKKKKHKINQ